MRLNRFALVRLALGVCLCGSMFGANAARAEDWMFRRSYYSHAAGPDGTTVSAPPSRSAYRQPFVGAHPHFAIRGGYRINNYTLNNGQDRTIIRESWYDANY